MAPWAWPRGRPLPPAHTARGRATLARAEGLCTTASPTTCSAARRIDHHGVLAAGFGDQRNGLPACRRAVRPGCRWRMRATSVEPVNITPMVRASATRAAPTVSSPAGQLHRAASRHSGLHGNAHRLARRSQGVCSGGLGSTGLPHQRRSHLAGENGQREVPRADADHRAERWVCVGKSGPRPVRRSSASPPHSRTSPPVPRVLPASRARSSRATNCGLRSSVGGAQQGGALRRGSGCPGAPLAGRRPGLIHLASVASCTWPTTMSWWSAGLRTGWVVPGRCWARRPGVPGAARALAQVVDRSSAPARCEIQPAGCCASAIQPHRQRNAWAGRGGTPPSGPLAARLPPVRRSGLRPPRRVGNAVDEGVLAPFPAGGAPNRPAGFRVRAHGGVDAAGAASFCR